MLEYHAYLCVSIVCRFHTLFSSPCIFILVGDATGAAVVAVASAVSHSIFLLDCFSFWMALVLFFLALYLSLSLYLSRCLASSHHSFCLFV